MFLARRPSLKTIDRFLVESRDLPVSYDPIGITSADSTTRRIDQLTAVLGHGRADFERARASLIAWKHFDIGWVETFPPRASITVGTVYAVLIRHLGFWSLNGCRVVDIVGGREREARFGFACGTLTNHAESGEEIFEVFIDPHTDEVIYRIRALSWPQAAVARIGQPVVRALQARFRHQSAAAMKDATCPNGIRG